MRSDPPALLVVLDGAPDDLESPITALERANIPTLDRLAQTGLCGSIFPIGPGVAPESHSGLVNLLGYRLLPSEVPRGTIEAQGAGLHLEHGDLALRVNFGTGDPDSGAIVDRRMCRSLSDLETLSLCKLLNRELPNFDDIRRANVQVEFVAVREYRGVLRVRADYALSEAVTNSDPGYPSDDGGHRERPDGGYQILTIAPMVDDLAAARTAEVLNLIVRSAHAVLRQADINVERRRQGLHEANMLLTRGPGLARRPLEPVTQRLGGPVVIVADQVIEVGVANHVGAEIAEYQPDNLAELVDMALQQLNRTTVPRLVVAHVKGPDEFGHDGDLAGKAQSLGMIDSEVIAPLAAEYLGHGADVIVTSDHATPCRVGVHTADPAPFLVSGGRFHESGVSAFNERAVSTTSPILGSELLNLVRKT